MGRIRKRLFSVILALLVIVSLVPIMESGRAYAAQITIEAVNPGITVPKAGTKRAGYTGFTYETDAHYKVIGITWTRSDGVTDFTEFEGGCSYSVTLDLEADPGYKFDYGTSLRISNATPYMAQVLDTNEVTMTSFYYYCQPPWPFADLDMETPGAYMVHDNYIRGIINGFGTDPKTGLLYIKPNKNVTRAQFAIMLFNLAKFEGVITDSELVTLSTLKSSKFSDVKLGDSGFMEIAWASSHGIIDGFANGKFKPNNFITRAQITKMLYFYGAKFSDGKVTEEDEGVSNELDQKLRSIYADYDDVQWEILPTVAWALKNEIMSGKTKGGKQLIAPNDYATRFQCAIFIHKYIGGEG